MGTDQRAQVWAKTIERDGKVYWQDHLGRYWRLSLTKQRLRFQKIPSHAALRAFVFHRDGYQCLHCGARATEPIPTDYTGQSTLDAQGSWMLVTDHILSIRNGGTHHPNNLQTLCDSCNARKAALIDRKSAEGRDGNESV